MRADVGFILIALGLVGVYLVLSGKFPPQSAPDTKPAQKTGSAGVSYQSALRLHKASNGGMR